MRFIYQFISTYMRPPRHMGFCYYSVKRNQHLYIIFPLNYLIFALWYLQDLWARKALQTSWIEDEIQRRRNKH